MKKMNILFILITSILIFGTTNVFAESCNGVYVNNFANKNVRTAIYTGNNSVDISLGYYVNQTQHTYSKYYFYYLIENTGGTITSNINWVETCQNTTSYGQGGNTWGTITYADGTTATISANPKNTICTNINSNGSITTTTAYEPEITTINATLRDSNTGNFVVCDFNKNNGIATCPYIEKFNTISFNVALSKYNTAILKIGIPTGTHYECSSDTQQIINNNNQNTTTINNSIQDTKDTITSNSIDSNTNTDNLITIPNSNGKNTILDLLMVPINFITSIVNSFSNSCVSYNLGNLLGTDLILPCINLQNILGSGLYNIIDAIFAFGMIFAFIRSVKKFIQKALLLASDVSSEVSIF